MIEMTMIEHNAPFYKNPMNIYGPYLFRELLITFAVVILSLELIIGGNVLARWLGRVAQGDYPTDVIAPFLLHGSLELLTTVLPFAAMLTTVLVLGRQQRGGELNAAFFLRIGHGDICAILMRFAAPLAVFLFVMLMAVMPTMQQEHETLKREAKQRLDVSVVTAGKFIGLGDDLALFVEGKDKHQLSRLFVAERRDSSIVVETAARGEQKTHADQTRWLHFYDGSLFETGFAEGNHRISTYEEHAILLPTEPVLLPLHDPDFKTFQQLLASSRPPDRVELHWRLSVSFSPIVLVLLAFVLTRARRSPYQAVLPATIVYLVYINASLLFANWISGGDWPAYSLWLSHLPFLVWIAWSLSWRPLFLARWMRRSWR